jgi:predicted ATPase
MSIILTVPHFGDVIWHQEDTTYVIGGNGTGKTLMLHEMMDHCDKKGINYNFYDAITALSLAEYLIDESEDMDVIMSCRAMAALSYDFAEDCKRWATVKGCEVDYMENAELLRHVLHLCGNGYTRMFIMTVLAMRNPGAGFYFMDLPETSLHVMLMRKIAEYLMHHFPHMKFVFATHSPELLCSLEDWYGDSKERNATKLISVPEDYLPDNFAEGTTRSHVIEDDE